MLLLIGSAFVQQSCEKIEDAISFGFNIRNDFTLPPNIPINTPFNLPGIPMDYNADGTFEQNNTKAELVKEIKLDYFKLTITEPVGQDFTFVKDVELKLNKDGVGEKLIAWKYDVSEDVGQVLDLEVTPDALDAYLKSNEGLTMSLRVTTDKLTTKEVKISSDIRVRVKADLFD